MRGGIALIVLVVSLATGGALAQETFRDRCVALDGDTLMCSDGERIRLHGVSAPEMHVIPWGPLARAALDEAIGDGMVGCAVVDKDSHGRRVAVCGNENADDLAAVVIAKGLATPHRLYLYPKGPTEKIHLYDASERQARSERRGFWRAAR